MKFSYFPVYGRGLACVLALEINDIAYEGRVLTGETWPEVKATGVAPFGQLPLLETDDVGAIAQGNAICAYIGRLSGNDGKDAKEKVVSDMLCGVYEDFWKDLAMSGQPTVMTKAQGVPVEVEKVNEKWATVYPARLASLEKLLNGKDKFTESGTTPGEIMLFAALYQMKNCSPTFLDKYTNLTAFFNRFLAHDKVKKVTEGQSPMGKLIFYLLPHTE